MGILKFGVWTWTRRKRDNAIGGESAEVEKERDIHVHCVIIIVVINHNLCLTRGAKTNDPPPLPLVRAFLGESIMSRTILEDKGEMEFYKRRERKRERLRDFKKN